MQRDIVPAIMPDCFEDIHDMVALVRHEVASVQLDIMDGEYVPERTWPFPDSDGILHKLRTEEISLPFWQDIDYELDLMIARPEEQLDVWLNLGASRVIFHYASVHDWKNIVDIGTALRNFVQIGIAITVHDNLEDVFALLDNDYFDFIQIMGIAHIGYQGEPFEKEVLSLIKAVRRRYPHMMINVDGGVSIESIPELVLVGVNRFVSGSGVFGGGLVKENIVELRSLLPHE